MKLRPKLLDRLILNEIVPLFFVMVVVFTSIILIAASADLIKYLTKGVPIWIVLQLIGFNILPWLGPTFPMAMLLSTIIGFVRLCTQSEIVALFASGVPFRRMVAPVLGFSLVITALALFTNDQISPYANRQFDHLKANLSHELDDTTTPFDLPAQRDDNGKLYLMAHVEGGYDITTHSMRDIYVIQVDPASGKIVEAIHAKAAQWSGGDNWTLMNPFVLANGMYGPVGKLVYKKLREVPDAVTFLQNGPDEFSFQELSRQLAELRASGSKDDTTIRDAEVSLWDKISLPVACIAFAIIGAPLGLRPQRSAALGVAITVGLGIIFSYYALYQYLHVLGASGHADPIFAAFFPDLLALIIGIGLLYRSSS